MPSVSQDCVGGRRMSLDAPLRPRPLSPHLAIYRLTSTLAQYLAEDGVKYDVVEHPFTVTALESAKASHISLTRLAAALFFQLGPQRH